MYLLYCCTTIHQNHRHQEAVTTLRVGGAKRVSGRGLLHFRFQLISAYSYRDRYLGVNHYFFPGANLPFGHVLNLSISARPYLSDPHCVARLM
jgi:hypothetical protein